MNRFRLHLAAHGCLLTLTLTSMMLVACAPSSNEAGGGDDTDATADLVVWGGTIATMSFAEGVGEVEALAVKDGRVLQTGTRVEIEPLVGDATEVVDLAGRFAMPGFVEAHAHFLGLGQAKLQLDLRAATSWQEIIEQVRQAAAETPSGEWIQGRGWHQEKWTADPGPTVEGFPVHDALSEAVPDHPVVLGHASGHAVFANAKAMELAGIDRDGTTLDPDGGAILRDAEGRATGVFNESAEGLIFAVVDQGGADLQRRRIEEATKDCLAKGVTSFHDAGASFEEIDLLRRAGADGTLGVRLWIMAAASTDVLAEKLAGYVQNGNTDMVTVGGVKRYMDGALGSRGAWLLEPYSDFDTTGHAQTTAEELRAAAEVVIQAGAQLCVHAIGDRANRVVLDVYEQTFADHPDTSDLRWRIEHAQHLHPDDQPRFQELGVVASMQPVHCTSDGPWVPQRLGDERTAAGAYMWSTLLDSGAVVVSGTDAPVEDVDPIANFYSAVTRVMGDVDGDGELDAFYPDESMTREEALRSMTRDAAWSVHQEDSVGSLEPGKLADLVVLSQNLLTAGDDEIPGTTVDLTLVGGKIAYRR